MGSKVWLGSCAVGVWACIVCLAPVPVAPSPRLANWVLLVLAFSLAWNRIEPQVVPSGCAVCMVFAKIVFVCVCGCGAIWVGACVCALVVYNLWYARAPKSFGLVCVRVLHYYCGGVRECIYLGAARTHKSVGVWACWAFYAVSWLCMVQVVGRRGELDLCVFRLARILATARLV